MGESTEAGGEVFQGEMRDNKLFDLLEYTGVGDLADYDQDSTHDTRFEDLDPRRKSIVRIFRKSEMKNQLLSICPDEHLVDHSGAVGYVAFTFGTG